MRAFTLALLVFVPLAMTGCKKEEAVQTPEALALPEAPKTLEEAFAKAPDDIRSEAFEAASLLKSGDYGRSLVLLQQLLAHPDLTGNQRTLASQSLLTAQQEVAKQADSGNKDLQKLLKYRSATK